MNRRDQIPPAVAALLLMGNAGDRGPRGAKGSDGLVGPVAAAYPRVAYVAKSGNDTNSGAPWAPKLTIQAAVDELLAVPTTQAEYEAGATIVVVGAGLSTTIYNETVTIPTRQSVHIRFDGACVVSGGFIFDWNSLDMFGSALRPDIVVEGVTSGPLIDFVETSQLNAAADGITINNDVTNPITGQPTMVVRNVMMGRIVDTNSNTNVILAVEHVRFGAVGGQSVKISAGAVSYFFSVFASGDIIANRGQYFDRCTLFGDITFTTQTLGQYVELTNTRLETNLGVLTAGGLLRMDGNTRWWSLTSNWTLTTTGLTITDTPWPVETPDAAWVSKGGNDSTLTGSADEPFLTIQAALNFANAAPTTQAEFLRPRVVHIVGPGTWTENVVMRTCASVTLMFDGPAVINGTVTFAVKGSEQFGSGVYPTCKIVGSIPIPNTGGFANTYDTQIGSGASSLVFAYTLGDLPTGQWIEATIENVWTKGTIGHNGVLGVGGQLRMRRCYLDSSGTYAIDYLRTAGAFTGLEVDETWDCVFANAVRFETYTNFVRCKFSQNITVELTSSAYPGFQACEFFGARTFTGPVSSARVDAFSESQLRAFTLAGGATVVRNDAGARIISTTVTEAALTGNTNDWAVSTKTSIHRISSTIAVDVTGFAGISVDGLVQGWLNVGANNITLKNQNVGSAATNRILGTGDVVIAPDAIKWTIYDGTTGRHRVMA